MPVTGSMACLSTISLTACASRLFAAICDLISLSNCESSPGSAFSFSTNIILATLSAWASFAISCTLCCELNPLSSLSISSTIPLTFCSVIIILPVTGSMACLSTISLTACASRLFAAICDLISLSNCESSPLRIASFSTSFAVVPPVSSPSHTISWILANDAFLPSFLVCVISA